MSERAIRITAGDVSVTATLDGSRTGRDLGRAAPRSDLGYWPPGRAFCIFFGRTPASTGDEIRPASAVNVFGRVSGDPTVFKKVRAGARVKLEQSDMTKG